MKVKFFATGLIALTGAQSNGRCPEGYEEISDEMGFSCADINECDLGTHTSTQPGTHTTTQSTTQSTVQPTSQSTTQSMTQSTTQPTTQSTTQPTTQSTTQEYGGHLIPASQFQITDRFGGPWISASKF